MKKIEKLEERPYDTVFLAYKINLLIDAVNTLTATKPPQESTNGGTGRNANGGSGRDGSVDNSRGGRDGSKPPQEESEAEKERLAYRKLHNKHFEHPDLTQGTSYEDEVIADERARILKIIGNPTKYHHPESIHVVREIIKKIETQSHGTSL